MITVFRFTLLLLLLGCFAVLLATNAQQSLLVIAGAESHGMLEACDCEREPGGGVAKRATLLDTLRKNSTLLLLDAGGFSAGGIYDDYTVGRSGDSLRTLSMINAMGAMHYSAVTVGDDDLQYGGRWLVQQTCAASLPLVSANCFSRDGTRLCDSFVVVNYAGMKIGITGVCTQESLFPRDTAVVIQEPVACLKQIWKSFRAASDIQIILSHTGQEISTRIAVEFPECVCIVNGHRKTDTAPVSWVGTTPIMQFGFQGKSLVGGMLQKTSHGSTLVNSRWYDVFPELADNPEIRKLLSPVKNPGPDKTVFDLYIMSQCPYGKEALAAFLHYLPYHPNDSLNVLFIGNANNDSSLVSLHGPGEVNDEKIWLAIQKLYPGKWMHFLQERTVSTDSSMRIAEKIGCSRSTIAAWVTTHGNSALTQHYQRSMRQSVDASPTLLINNRQFTKEITAANLHRAACARPTHTDSICASLPECDSDGDCRAARKIGVCTSQKRCLFTDDTACTFTVVTADSTIQHPEKMAIATTMELFPAASVITLSNESDQGKQLLRKYDPPTLPLYHFSQSIERTHNFAKIADGLVKYGNVYTFKNGAVPANYYWKRKKIPGSVILFIDPFFKGLSDILLMVVDDAIAYRRIDIQPVIFADPASVVSGSEEHFRQEEAFRWLIIAKKYRAQKNAYLRQYLASPGSSFWQEYCKGTAIPPDSLVCNQAYRTALLNDHWKSVASLGIQDGVVLLIDNVQTAVPGGAREMRRILTSLLK